MMKVLRHVALMLVLVSTAAARHLSQEPPPAESSPLTDLASPATDALNAAGSTPPPAESGDNTTANAGETASAQSYANITQGLKAANSTPTANLSVMTQALNASGLTLSNLTNVTILAPTDEAFKKRLPELGITQDELLDPQNNETLVKILSYHVIEGVYNTTNSTDGANLTTLAASNVSITVDTRFSPYEVSFQNLNATYNASVVSRDIQVNDSIVHVVDDVLVPDDLTAAADGSDMTITATQGAAANESSPDEATAGGTNSTA